MIKIEQVIEAVQRRDKWRVVKDSTGHGSQFFETTSLSSVEFHALLIFMWSVDSDKVTFDDALQEYLDAAKPGVRVL